MTKQTYETYFKDYYHENRERIIANSKEYRLKYSKEYYRKNKKKIAAKAQLKRLEAKVASMDAKSAPSAKSKPSVTR